MASFEKRGDAPNGVVPGTPEKTLTPAGTAADIFPKEAGRIFFMLSCPAGNAAAVRFTFHGDGRAAAGAAVGNVLNPGQSFVMQAAGGGAMWDGAVSVFASTTDTVTGVSW